LKAKANSINKAYWLQHSSKISEMSYKTLR